MSNWLTAEIPSRPLGMARVMIGCAAAVRAIVAWGVLAKLADEGTLKAPYFDWMPEPSLTVAAVLVSLWFVSAVLFAIGWRVGWAGGVLLTSLVFTLTLDQQTYSNHLYLMALLVLLLVVGDAGAGMNHRRTDRPVARWPVFLLKAQASIVYGFAAITKLNADFLSGKVIAGVVYGGLVEFPGALRTRSVFVFLSIATVVVELYLAAFLWSKRLRATAFGLGLLLHVPIVLIMPDTWELIVFAVEMFALYPLFLPAEKLVVLWDDGCGSCRGWIRRFSRLDLLRLLDPVGKSEGLVLVSPVDVERSIHVAGDGSLTRGFKAITRILEHLVPTLWVAPLLRVPGVSALGERWYHWQARRRSCAVGIST